MKRLASALAVATALLGATAAHATIVNISGTAAGEETGGADCSVACRGALISPAQLTLGAGTYTVRDAYDPSTGLAPGALYDAWNFQAGNGRAWAWHWKALIDDGSHGSTITTANYDSFILLDVDTTQAFTTEAEAAAFGAATAPSTFTLNATTTLDFVVNDYFLADNAGGVSLSITRDRDPGGVPEPATWAMMVLGFAGLGGALRRRRAAAGGPRRARQLIASLSPL